MVYHYGLPFQSLTVIVGPWPKPWVVVGCSLSSSAYIDVRYFMTPQGKLNLSPAHITCSISPMVAQGARAC